MPINILNVLVKDDMSITDKKVRKKRRWGKIFEYSSYERNLIVGDEYEALFKELEDEYSKKKSIVVTAQEIATKRDIRVSVAKQLLEDLEEKNILKPTIANKRFKVYTKT